MAYTKTNWQNGVTPVNADNMNKIENELEALDQASGGGSENALVKPSTPPNVIELVGIDTNGEQVRIQVDTNDFEIDGTTSPYTLKKKEVPTTISVKIAYQNTYGASSNTYKVNNGDKTDITYKIGSGSSTSFTLEQLQAITTEITGINKLEVYGTGSLAVEVRIYNSNGVLTHNFNNGEAYSKYFDITQYIENGGFVVIYGDD